MTDSLMASLEPCPFCGTEMELIHDHTVENIDTIQHKTAQPYCPIDGSSGFGIGNENLVEAWNRRAALSTPPTVGQEDKEALVKDFRAAYEAAKTLLGFLDVSRSNVPAFAVSDLRKALSIHATTTERGRA